MAQALKVPGRAVGETDEFRAEADQLGLDDGLKVQLRDEVRIDPTARSDAAQVEVEGDERDVVEIVHNDGYVDFATFRELHRASAADRGAASVGDVNLMRALEGAVFGPATRGDRSTLEAVRRYGVEFPSQVAADIDLLEGVKGVIDRAAEPLLQEAARRVIKWVERPVADGAPAEERRGRPKSPGLYQVTFDLHLEPGNRLAAPPPRSDQPYLLLVHGTQSHTENAFGGLAGTEEWQSLFDGYDGNVLAFEHPTLSASPLENAVALVESLPEAAQLDVVSHSRGGLIGDVLSVAAGQHLDLTVLERAAREAEIDLVQRLFAAAGERGLRVRRFVRAGCPSSGTLLASRRLDQYAKWLFWAIRKIPGFGGVGAILKTLILSILELRMNTEVAPGIEAQMPESPFIRWLNTNRRTIDDGLAVLAADVQGRGIGGRAKVAAADLFYREDHDYVVNTRAMTQGARRTKAHYTFHKGEDATHFTYFQNPGSRGQLAAWLLREEDDPPRGFLEVDRDARKLTETKRRAERGTEPIVVFVPAFMGSALLAGDQQVWPSPEELAARGVDALSPERDELEVGEPLARVYQPLTDALGAAGLDMVHCSWDWRLGLDAAAEQLAAQLAALADEYPAPPIHVLAHSTGGLVALLATVRKPELWQRLRDREGRTVLVGCPTMGSYRALQLATAEDELAQMLAVTDPGEGARPVAELFAGYPAVLASLPGPLHADWWRPEWWSETLGAEPGDGLLAAARKIRQELEDAGPAADVLYVAGGGLATPVDFQPEPLGFLALPAGDGVVTTESAAPASGRAFIAPGVGHGRLVNDAGVVRAIAGLLHGEPGGDLLQPVESATVAEPADDAQPMRSPAGNALFPTAHDLAEAAVGLVTSIAEAEPAPALHIEVMHGDLRWAEYPLVVGHYQGATLKGAEGALDSMLEGALRDRHLLGVYPGPVGTADIITRSSGERPPGAIIIGLGEIGDITPTKITRSITQMALQHALLVLERARAEGTVAVDQEGEAGCVPANFSTLLIGTSGINSLNVVNSMAAIVKGALAANRLLEQRGLLERVRIDRIQFVELYEDLAVEATHAARSLSSELGVEERVKAAPRLVAGEGGLPGRPQSRYDEGQWRRIEVETRIDEEAGLWELAFTSTGGRARAEQEATAGQRALIDELIGEAVNNPQAQSQVHNTLYELLLPNAMKNEARQTDNLLFVLDREAANYPWEVLASRSSSGGDEMEPLSTQVGMLRRLKTASYRENVQTATGMKALVIGDPPAGDKLPRLPGARQEAAEVAALLSDIGYEVTALIYPAGEAGSSSLDLVNALFANDYRIVHIAAHGHYDAAHPERSGVVIGDGRYLSPPLIRQIQAMPALVFLNCCHLGQVGPLHERAAGAAGEFHLFAASVSQQLIQDGVKAVIAAGWAVDDIAARQFATEFYENLLRRGKPFGDAIQVARSKVYDDHRERSNTWGAYQCYGDPGFSLVVSKDDEGGEHRFVARAEMLARARDLEQEAEKAEGHGVGKVIFEIDRLVRDAPKDWIDGEVAYVIGNAYSHVGEFDKAIRFHRLSKSRWGDGRAFRLLRVLANNESRRAAELHFDPPPGLPDQERLRQIDDYLSEAATLLKALVEVAPDAADVHAHYASHEKRKAHIKIDEPDVRDAALEVAREHYEKAHHLSLQKNGEIHTWPAMNWAALRCLAQLQNGQPDDAEPTVEELLEACRTAANRAGGTSPGFWHSVVAPDSLVYGALAGGLLGADVPDDEVELRIAEIVAGYEATLETRSNARFRRSVVEQLWFLSSMLQDHEVEHQRLIDLMHRVQQVYDLSFIRVPAG